MGESKRPDTKYLLLYTKETPGEITPEKLELIAQTNKEAEEEAKEIINKLEWVDQELIRDPRILHITDGHVNVAPLLLQSPF